ncbi:hypothetical protein QYF36_026498 [Acer negundo]|nr:hypothetical protein QYF36_026498 [Acer negundo]
MFSFQKLNNVKVHDCMSLKYLFPVSIAESLLELERLDVYNCGVEEFVVDDQGEANVAATFFFPRITSLEFNQLPRLKTFYRGVHTSQWQNLKRLTMCDCDKVELFASENNKGQHGSSVQPLFIVKKRPMGHEAAEFALKKLLWSLLSGMMLYLIGFVVWPCLIYTIVLIL